MPRSRGSELPQRTSPRAPLHLKTTTACTDTNGAHHRPVVDRTSPKLADRHSPRSPLHEKKRAGTRVAELETKLGKVQDELKKLREQLVSAEAAKKDAQVALEEAKKHVGTTKGGPAAAASPPSPTPVSVESEKTTEELKVAEPAAEEDQSSINFPATDVFEVVRTESGDKENQSAVVAEVSEEVSCGDKAVMAEKEEVEVEETKTMIEEDNSVSADIDGGQKESPEVAELKAKLMVKEMEVDVLAADNAELKKKAGEAAEAAKRAEDEAVTKAFLIEQDLKGAAPAPAPPPTSHLPGSPRAPERLSLTSNVSLPSRSPPSSSSSARGYSPHLSSSSIYLHPAPRNPELNPRIPPPRPSPMRESEA